MGFSSTLEGPDPDLEVQRVPNEDKTLAKTTIDMAYAKDSTQGSLNGYQEMVQRDDEARMSDEANDSFNVTKISADVASTSGNNNVDTTSENVPGVVTNLYVNVAVATRGDDLSTSSGNQEPEAAINGELDSSPPFIGNTKPTGATHDDLDSSTASINNQDLLVEAINDGNHDSSSAAATNEHHAPVATNSSQEATNNTTQNEATEEGIPSEWDEEAENHSEEEDEWDRVRMRENVVWLRQVIDKETYIRNMAPQYYFLDLSSISPIQDSHLKRALTHLARQWPWWRLQLRLRGPDRTPWICTEPLQPLHYQMVDSVESTWNSVEDIQQRHTNLWGGPLCTTTLHSYTPNTPDTTLTTDSTADTTLTTDDTTDNTLTNGMADTSLTANGTADATLTTNGTANTALTPNSTADTALTTNGTADTALTTNGTTDTTLVRNVDATLTGGDTADTTAASSSSTTSSSSSTSNSSSTSTSTTCAFLHRYQLLLGVPQAFAEDSTIVNICDTLVTLLEEVLAEGITEEEVEPVSECPPDTESQKTEYEEKLDIIDNRRSVCTVNSNNADVFTSNYNGEENEADDNGYVERTIDPVLSRNFINKCKAERVSYFSGFTACVSAATANLALEVGLGPESGTVVVDHKLFVHYNWPEAPYEWHDNYDDHETDDSVPEENSAITIKARPEEWNTNFWRTAKSVHKKHWEMSKGVKYTTQKIPLNLEREVSEDEEEVEERVSPRFPNVTLSISNVSLKSSSLFSRHGKVVSASGLGKLSMLRHLLFTHTINLQVQEESQSLHFYLSHSTLFFPTAAGRRFADEIVSQVRSSLAYR